MGAFVSQEPTLILGVWGCRLGHQRRCPVPAYLLSESAIAMQTSPSVVSTLSYVGGAKGATADKVRPTLTSRLFHLLNMD